MKWRCEWCGKPHDENDPPCDNCGHGSFERAVVQQTDLAEGGGREETIVWVCPECGRAHPKHNPPCSRCGHPTLVKERQTVDDSELSAAGYLDLLTPRYALGIVAGIALAALFVLGLAGIVPIPGLSDGGVPTVADVPGAAETADGLSLSTVEAVYIEELNAARAEAGYDALTENERLGKIATFYNQRRVKAAYDTGSTPDRDRLRSLLSESCSGQIVQITVPPAVDRGDYESASALGSALAAQTLSGGLLESQHRTGVDVHVAPDGMVYLTQYACQN